MLKSLFLIKFLFFIVLTVSGIAEKKLDEIVEDDKPLSGYCERLKKTLGPPKYPLNLSMKRSNGSLPFSKFPSHHTRSSLPSKNSQVLFKQNIDNRAEPSQIKITDPS